MRMISRLVNVVRPVLLWRSTCAQRKSPLFCQCSLTSRTLKRFLERTSVRETASTSATRAGLSVSASGAQ